MIAIIIVNYNGLEDTIECVKSILKSSYSEYRIVIVDNASRDAKKIENITLLHDHADIILSSDNTGFAGGNNIGIRFAQKRYDPDYYLLLNNDTVVNPEAIANLVKAYEKSEKAGITTGTILYYSHPKLIWAAGGKFDFNTGIADQPELGKVWDQNKHGISETTFSTGCLMLIEKKIIEKVGLLEESYFLYAEDTDYCCRVLNAGYKIYLEHDAIIYHKVSASTGKQSKQQQYYLLRNNLYIIKKYCKFPFYGYMRRIYRILKMWKKESYQFLVLLRAWRDYRKGITGKIDNI